MASAEDTSASNRVAWSMAVCATIGTMCSAISVIFVNTGIFMRPLEAAFGWNRADVALALSVGAVVMAVTNPIVGDLLDRFGTRRVILMSQLGYGITILCMPMLIRAGDLMGLYVGFGLIAALGAGSSIVGYIRLLSGWFAGPRLASRGLAMGCCSSGVPMGAAVSGPLAILLIENFGWEAGFQGLALMPLALSLPITFFMVRDVPKVEAVHGAAHAEPGMSMAEAFRSRPFWMLLAMVLLISSCLQGMSIHILPFLSDQGISEKGLAAMALFTALLAIPARMIAGHLFDRYFAPHVALVIFALPAVGALIMAVHPTLIVAIAGSILLAVGQGAESDYVGYLVSRYFGLRNSGRLFGLIYGVFMLGVAIGPFLFGKAFDLWGSYTVPFAAATTGLTLLCIIMLFLPRFKDH